MVLITVLHTTSLLNHVYVFFSKAFNIMENVKGYTSENKETFTAVLHAAVCNTLMKDELRKLKHTTTGKRRNCDRLEQVSQRDSVTMETCQPQSWQQSPWE